jgi:hypothetical protein
VTNSDHKKRGRLNIISHLLGLIPYKAPRRQEVKLPKRQRPGGYRPSDNPLRDVPHKF